MLTSRAVIGEIVGGYRIVSSLGQGGTGEVFVAEHASVGAKAAIKILSPSVTTDAARVKRYLRDVQAASRVGSQGTVKVTGAGTSPSGHTFVVMELVQGETLAAQIARTRRLSITQIAELGRQLATAVAAMHEDNLVHGDLRPAKVLLVRDSGLAGERVKLLAGDAALLGPTHAKAAPYLAPEVWRDPEAVDWRADVYALGCMLFEMATGQPPYVGGDLAAKHRDHQVPTARSLMPDVPPALDLLIARLMSKHIAQRPKSMRVIARELDRLCGTDRPLASTVQDQPVLVVGELTAGTLPPGPPPEVPLVPAPPARARPSRIPIIAVVIAVAVLAGVVAVVLAAGS